jgi:hypothetical protein
MRLSYSYVRDAGGEEITLMLHTSRGLVLEYNKPCMFRPHGRLTMRLSRMPATPGACFITASDNKLRNMWLETVCA